MYHSSFDSPFPSLQPNQGYSPLNRINLDMDIKNLLGTQEYYAGQGSGGNQDYYMGQYYSMGYGSAHSSAHGSSQGLGMSGPSDPVVDDFPVKEATPVKAKKEQIQGYDAISSKWKNRVRPIIGQFCVIYDNIERRNEIGSSNLTEFQKALEEYEAQYDHDF
ncbi:hypothetical protein Tco_0863936 [Tanacetum coccineum]